MKQPTCRMSAADRFEASYIPEPNSGCWIWERAFNAAIGGDRPQFGVDGKRVTAHRYSYKTFVGPIPAGLLICHRCDTPLCVNPDHLYAGTHKQNTADMMRAGRHFSQRPEGKAALTERILKVAASRRAAMVCKRGHPFEGNNLIVARDGRRSCRTCQRARQRLAKRAKRLEATNA